MDKNKRSKYLSFLLRHHPEDAKLDMMSGGWVNLSQLIANTDFTEDELIDIVNTDEKKRYELIDGKIRAVQGHSCTIDMQYKETIPPNVLYHGTSDKVHDIIIREGIKKMSRQYVHLSKDVDTAKIVGKRHGGNLVILKINTVKMIDDGYKFYVADNGVWLTDYIPPKYITEWRDSI